MLVDDILRASISQNAMTRGMLHLLPPLEIGLLRLPSPNKKKKMGGVLQELPFISS
jgi:hypothetical protein